VALGEAQRDLLPVPRRVDHPVDQDDRRPAARDPVDDAVPVEVELPLVERAHPRKLARHADDGRPAQAAIAHGV
jgi:hypothetical protein